MSILRIGLAITLTFFVLTGAGCRKDVTQEISQPQEPEIEVQEIEQEQDSSMQNRSEPGVVEETTAMESTTETEEKIIETDSTDPVPAENVVNESVKEEVIDTVTEDPEEKEEPAPVVKQFSIEAKQWEFVPSVITVNKGDTVKLSVTSTDVAHGISISAFGVSERLEPNQTVQIEFIADKEGTFSMICSVFCGSGHGSMRGSVIVQ